MAGTVTVGASTGAQISDGPCSCCCPDGSRCFQHWTAIYNCCLASWSGPIAGPKTCLPNDTTTDWTVDAQTPSECVYGIFVPLSMCCTSDGECSGLSDSATPSLPSPFGCCTGGWCAECADGDPVSVDVAFSLTACTGCLALGLNPDVEWAAGTDLNQTINLLPTDPCTYEGELDATLHVYESRDATCTTLFEDRTHFRAVLVRDAFHQWQLTVTDGPYLLFNGDVSDIATCAEEFDISSAITEECPGYYVDAGATAHFTPMGCPSLMMRTAPAPMMARPAPTKGCGGCNRRRASSTE